MARPSTIYNIQLQQRSAFILNITRGVYAFPECDEEGNINIYQKLPLKYRILQLLREDTYVCSCAASIFGPCIHVQKCKSFISLNNFAEHIIGSEVY